MLDWGLRKQFAFSSPLCYPACRNEISQDLAEYSRLRIEDEIEYVTERDTLTKAAESGKIAEDSEGE